MARAVRKVPASWQHPTDAEGDAIPMYASFPFNAEEVAEGLRDGWLAGAPPHYDVAVMPQWPEAERTHLQLYDNVGEAIPLSPVCATPSALAQWLVEHHGTVGSGRELPCGEWLSLIEGEIETMPQKRTGQLLMGNIGEKDA